MDQEPLLPRNGSDASYIRPGPKHTLKIALRIKQLIDIIVPIEFDSAVIERADSPVITERIMDLVRDAAGGKGNGKPGTSSRAYRATLVFILLKVRSWYLDSAEEELHDAGLYNLRANAAEQIAARLIEAEADERYLFREVLCQRYSITIHGEDSNAANALEAAVDQHATKIIATAGYQRCRKWLWRGWIVQSGEDPDNYVFYSQVANTRFKVHFHPDRIKTPQYQNMMLVGFSVIYLILYTFTINTLQKSGHLDLSEVLFFLFTAGFILDEVIKLYHIGVMYIGFWNAFNDTLYSLVVVSFVFRVLALSHHPDSPSRDQYLLTAYRMLACCAPFIWCRLLLYLDSLQFFGAMLVVLSELIKESVIFFVLLLAVSAGFFQAFIGLDSSDGNVDFLSQTSELMFMTIMGNPAYDALGDLAHPYGQILYYLFAFLICTLLLNILIALFTSAYDHIYDNATEEYLALIAEKTLRYVRSPDENVYVPPLNLIELLFSTIPFEWWMSDSTFAKLNDIYLTIIYSPVLLIIAYTEAKDARRVSYNRLRGLSDDANERDQEWDLLDGYSSGDDSDEDESSIRQAVVHQAHKRHLQNGSNISHETSAELEQMNLAIAHGDPEFHTDEHAWLKAVMKQAPQIDLGDKSGAGWNNYWLVKEITQLKNELRGLRSDTNKKSKAAVSSPSSPPTGAAATAPTAASEERVVTVTPDELSKIVNAAVQQALLDFVKQGRAVGAPAADTTSTISTTTSATSASENDDNSITSTIEAPPVAGSSGTTGTSERKKKKKNKNKNKGST